MKISAVNCFSFSDMAKLDLSQQDPAKLITDQQQDFYDSSFPYEGSFGLRVNKTGTRTWFHFTAKSRKRITLGKWPDLTYAAALKLCLSHSRTPGSMPKTVLELVQLFEERHVEAKLSKKTRSEYKRIASTELIPRYGSLRLASLSPAPFINLIEEIKFERKRETYSERVRSYLSSLFNFAKKRGFVSQNPIKSIEPDLPPLSKTKHLSVSEIVSIWRSLDKQNPIFASLIKCSFLLAQKPTSLVRLERKELLEDRVLLFGLVPVQYTPLFTESLPEISKGEFVFSVNERAPISDVSRRMNDLPATSTDIQASVLELIDPTVEQRKTLKGKASADVSGLISKWQKELAIELGQTPSNIVRLFPNS